MIKKLFIGVLILILLSGCSGVKGGNGGNPTSSANPDKPEVSAAPSTTPAPDSSPSPSEGNKGEQKPTSEPKLTKQQAAEQIVLALKSKNTNELNKLIHPVKGVLFSPYLYIDKNTAQIFKANQLPAFDDSTPYIWGEFDGSGETIKMTFSNYYEKFVFDHDYSKPEKLGEDEVLHESNTVNNIKEIFPDSYIADYHFSGFDQAFGGADWSSLIIVMEQHDGNWYVSAIVHSAWTV